MPLAKRRYTLDGEIWFRISHAAMLIGTNPAGIRKMMAAGTLEWRQLRMNSKTLLVAERDVIRIRHERQQWRKEGAFKAEPRKYAPRPPQTASRGGFDVFDRTGDPSPGPRLPLVTRKRERED